MDHVEHDAAAYHHRRAGADRASSSKTRGVSGEPVAPDKLTDLTVTMPQPKGWQQYSNPNFAPGTQVIAKGDTYPTAMLIVFKLTGDFDVDEAIKHGYADAELSQNFKRLNASTDNWHGFPVVDDRGQLRPQRPAACTATTASSSPTGAPPANQRYLVQFTVTGYADKAAEEAPDIEAVIAGFNVAQEVVACRATREIGWRS